MPEPIIFDLAQKTRFSILNKNRALVGPVFCWLGCAYRQGLSALADRPADCWLAEGVAEVVDEEEAVSDFEEDVFGDAADVPVDVEGASGPVGHDEDPTFTVGRQVGYEHVGFDGELDVAALP